MWKQQQSHQTPAVHAARRRFLRGLLLHLSLVLGLLVLPGMNLLLPSGPLRLEPPEMSFQKLNFMGSSAFWGSMISHR